MKPVLKWAGGKRQLLSVIGNYINEKTLSGHTYFEPFLGGGSLFFSLAHNKCVVNDANRELINVYESIRDNPDKLIEYLSSFKMKNSKDFYYQLRALDRQTDWIGDEFDNCYKAARTIYINKTCYNGLYRVNKKGQFNTPYGKYMKPLIFENENIYEISKFLNAGEIEFYCKDFAESVRSAKKGDIIYFDPPYDYENEQGFVNYIKDGFSHSDLQRLKKVCDSLISKECLVLISNNDTSYVRNLFKGDSFEIIYETKSVMANRTINCKGKERKKVGEVLIYGRKKDSVSTSK